MDGCELEANWDAVDAFSRRSKAAQFEAFPGRTYTLEKAMAVFTSRDPDAGDIGKQAQEAADRAIQAGYAACFAGHREVWDKIWAQTDIRISGDDECQRLTRFALYHLAIAAPWKDTSISIGARALSGKMYDALVYWETDIYLGPYYSWVFPICAQNHFVYRYKTLDGARANAVEVGKTGAKYPWAGAHLGVEEVPRSLVCGGTQVHIVPDVAHALMRYVETTGDKDLYFDKGVEILAECARFMAQLASFNAKAERYEIDGVGGPDEYHPVINNNAYTNYLTRGLFKDACDALSSLKESQPTQYSELVSRLGVTDEEVGRWSDIAKRLYFPVNDATGLIEQCDGFFLLNDEWDVVGERHGGPAAEYDTCKGIKQPDVLLLLALFPERFQHKHLLANWDYYERFIQHGSSLSPSIHALIAAKIGLVQKAREYFQLSARFAFVDYNKDSRGGVHIGNFGGLWQSLVFGFAGMELADGVMRFTPHLPLEWKGLEFNLVYQGNKFSVAVSAESVSLTADRANRGAVKFASGGQTVQLDAGETAAVKV